MEFILWMDKTYITIENNWAEEIWRYSQWEILILSIWVTGVMKKWQKCPPQKEIWFAAQTNPIQHFPKFDGSQLWCRNGFSHWKEIWKAVERNPIEGFPKFDGLSESPSSFEEVSWHFVKKKTAKSPSKSEFICMGGLINRFLPVWCPISHSIWPLLFPHQLSGGSGTRLSIRRQDPNNYSDTEMRALSNLFPCCVESLKLLQHNRETNASASQALFKLSFWDLIQFPGFFELL